MTSEYLLFNVFIFALPFGFGWLRPFSFKGGRWPAFGAALCASVPFLVWDMMVAGEHWFFNPDYTLGIRLLGLPIEEIMFFFTVPFACLYTWEKFFTPFASMQRSWLMGARWLWWLWLPVGVWFLWDGKTYTGLTCIALGAAAGLDWLMRTALLLEQRVYVFLGVITALTLVFNGYLTARPVVTYATQYQLDFRIWTVPIEDFGFGIALLLCNLVLYQWFRGRLPANARVGWVARWIESRFGGFRHRVVTPNESLPRVLADKKRVAVIGAGIAGLRAAMSAAERGFEVVVFDKNDYIGGKIGAWSSRADDGSEFPVSHGFHAFFRHYYNLNQMIEELGCQEALRGIDDYLILDKEGHRYSFKDVSTTPVLNLISLAQHGIYSLGQVAVGPAGRKMESFLRYDAEKTYEKFDRVSFESFSQAAQLPSSLQLIFNSFSRAFFSDPDRMSMAALMESFHFYYLSHDHGLLYDYFDDDYEVTLLAPIRGYLASRGATLRLETPVTSLVQNEDGFAVNGEPFSYVVLASDVVGTKRIVEESSLVDATPEWREQLATQSAAQGYSVWRVWVDRDLPENLSPFFITDRVKVLDAVAIYHRLESSATAWVGEHGGAVLEFHCYALPTSLTDDEAVKACFLDEFFTYFPAMKGMNIAHEYFQRRYDFASYQVGTDSARPGVETPVPGLFLAGDWIKLPYPAMLMEAACMSGLLAANSIFAAEGLQASPVDSVPLRGCMADFPTLPGS